MIIIDYYNFLYYRYADITESIIRSNLKLLTYFVNNKKIVMKVVFDGIHFQDIDFKHNKINLHFSSWMTADDYIINMFMHLQGRSHILISHDRALITAVQRKSNASVLSPQLFWKELDLIVNYSPVNTKQSPLIKTTEAKDDDIDALFQRYFNDNKK
jgi:hypothetical protein